MRLRTYPGEHVLDETNVAGTSMNDSFRPDERSVNAKPKSIVRPRSFSSVSRSGSVPVSARTKVDLP